MKKAYLVLALLIIAGIAYFAFTRNLGLSISQITNYLDGDIVFQTTQSDQCRAVQLATHSPYSHCGILFYHESQWQVLEAVSSVKWTPIEEWIHHGVDKKIKVMRLKNRNQVLTKDIIEKMKTTGQHFLGKHYDFTFEWSDDKIYCSELVWKIYKQSANMEVGKLSRLKNFDLSHPTVQSKLKERYGSQIPYDELVIPPSSIFEHEKLYEVN